MPRKPRIVREDEWSAEQLALLKALHADKRPYREIADKTGRKVNAVKSMAHRLGLPKRDKGEAMRLYHRSKSEASVEREESRRSSLEPLAPFIPAERPPAPAEAPVTLMDRTDAQCGWVKGETCGPLTLMCGAPKPDTPSVPYCGYHTSLAAGYSRPTMAERREATLRSIKQVTSTILAWGQPDP